MSNRATTSFLLAVLVATASSVLVVGCSRTEEATDTPPPTEAVKATSVPAEPTSTVRPLPSLYPTATQGPSVEPTSTGAPRPTEPANTPIAFDQQVVELRYTIPGLGLDRRISGDISSRVKVTDEVSGESAERNNQTGVLLELQQVLTSIELAELPDDCELCVTIEYSLPLADLSGTGWLQDPLILASIENYTSAVLSPYFPADAVVALRRSATPYDVAHSVALTAGGELWRWTATQPEIEAPVPLDEAASDLLALAEQLDVASLSDSYGAPCPEGSGVETLYVETTDVRKQISVICPELSIPASLLPLYLQLDALATELTAGEGLPKPEPAIGLAALIFYSREDGVELTIDLEGLALTELENSKAITTTISLTDVVAISDSLLGSGLMQPGVDTFVSGEVTNILVLRAEDGVYEFAWDDPAPDGITETLAQLDQLIADLSEAMTKETTEGSAATPPPVAATEPAGTPEATTTATATPPP